MAVQPGTRVSDRRFRVDLLGPAGLALVRGSFDLLHVELDAGGALVLTGSDEQGRRATVRIPCEMIEEVPVASDPHTRAHLVRRTEPAIYLLDRRGP